MSYGLSIINKNGKTFITPDVTPLNFIKKINVWIPSKNGGGLGYVYLNTEISEEYIVLPFIRALNVNYAYARVSGSKIENSQTILIFEHYEYYSSGGYWIEVYLFSNFAPASPNYGIEIINKKGNVVYNNLCKPLDINYMEKPDHNLFGINNSIKERNSIMTNIGYPVASLCTSYGLKSFNVGSQNGSVTYSIFSTAIGDNLGLHLLWYRSDGRFVLNYPNIGNIVYIDVRKYQ